MVNKRYNMGSQGHNSCLSGRTFEREVTDILKKLTQNVQSEVRDGEHRYDVVANDIIFECKFFSGQPGTIWQKIPWAIWRARKTKNTVFVLGGHPSNKQYIELKQFAKEVVPYVSVILVEELTSEFNRRTSEKHKSRCVRFLSYRPRMD